MNLKDIAKKAGVSTATVSNVINGNYHKVSEETRRRVEEIVREADYKPNAMARSLAKRESRIIGLVVPYIGHSENFLVNPYNAHIIAALEQYVRNHDYYLMLRCVGGYREILPLLSSWNVDGAFFLGMRDSEVRSIREGINAPLVFLDTYAAKEPIVNVGIDDYRGGYLSARYLIGKGHKQIALVTPDYSEEGVVRERFRGFSDACAESGIRLEKDDIFRVDSIYQSAMQVGQDIAFGAKKHTAVATMSDIVAIGVIEGLRQCGVRVPEEMSVIGFDNLPECELMSPKLTTVGQDLKGKAERAGELMMRMLAGERDLVLSDCQPIRVVERQSVLSIAD